MNVPVDIVANFNRSGTIEPKYIRLENDQHRIVDHKIVQVLQYEEHIYAGLGTIEISCQLDDQRILNLIYIIKRHIWMVKK